MAQIRISLAQVTNFYTKPLCSTPQIHSSDEFVSPSVLTNNEHAEQVSRKEKQITVQKLCIKEVRLSNSEKI